MREKEEKKGEMKGMSNCEQKSVHFYYDRYTTSRYDKCV